MANTASIRLNKRSAAREPRTLGLAVAGTQLASSAVGAVGSAAATALGVAAAVKPLILAGLAKYALWNYLNRPGNNIGLSVGYNAPDFNTNPGYISNSEYYPVNQDQFTLGEFNDDNSNGFNTYNSGW